MATISLWLDRLVDLNGAEITHVITRQPHVHDDGDLEIRFGILEQGVELLKGVLGAEQFAERLLVVLAPASSPP